MSSSSINNHLNNSSTNSLSTTATTTLTTTATLNTNMTTTSTHNRNATRSLRSGIVNINQRLQQSKTRKGNTKESDKSKLNRGNHQGLEENILLSDHDDSSTTELKQMRTTVEESYSPSELINSTRPQPAVPTREIKQSTRKNPTLDEEFPVAVSSNAIPNFPQSISGYSDIVEPMVQLRNAISSLISQYSRPNGALSLPPNASTNVKSDTISTPIAWANLLSEYSDQPHIELNHSNFTIGRSSRCNLQLRDNTVSGLVCRIFPNPNGPPSLESCTGSGALSVNNVIIRKGTKCLLKSGDRITIAAAVKPCSYVFQQISTNPILSSFPPPLSSVASSNMNIRKPSRPIETTIVRKSKDLLPLQNNSGKDLLNNCGNDLQYNSEKDLVNTSGNDFQNNSEKDVRIYKENSNDDNRMETEVVSSLPPPTTSKFEILNLKKRSLEVTKTMGKKAMRLDTTHVDSSQNPDVLPPMDNLQPVDGLKNEGGGLDKKLNFPHLKDSEKLMEEKSRCKEAFQKMLLNPEDIEVSFDTFPYIVTTETKQLLVSSCFPFLKRPQFLKYTSSVLSMNRCFLISGPLGTEIYQEKLVQALCRELGVHLLVFDYAAQHTGGKEKSNFPFPYPRKSTPSSSLVKDSHPKLETPNINESNRGMENESNRVMENESNRVMENESSSLVDRSTLQQVSLFGREQEELVQDTESPLVSSEAPTVNTLKSGDRVKYMGLPIKKEDPTRGNCCSSSLSPYPKTVPSSSSIGLSEIPPLFSRIGLANRQNDHVRGPLVGYKGRVVLAFEDNPSKVGVRFDLPVYGGNNLGNRCEDDHGFFVNVNELRLESECSWEDCSEIVALEALLETALGWEATPNSLLSSFLSSHMDEIPEENSNENVSICPKSQPCVVYLPDVEKLVFANYERYANFKRQLDNLPTDTPLVVIGSSIALACNLEGKKERPSGTASLLFSKSGGGYSSLLDLSLFDTLTNRFDERIKKNSKATKMLGKLFPVKVELHAPRGGKELAFWNRQISTDIETLRCKENICTLGRYLDQSRIICDKFPESQLKEKVLDVGAIQKVISWAVSRHLENTKAKDITTRDGCLVISEGSLGHAIEMLLAAEAEAASIDQSLRDVVPENEFEKRLLQEAVIPSIEVSVKFDDVGALEKAKKSLQELVMLPLQRPELFTRGQLTTPCKGILLFGPPGTGKTMLAKAVATEAGAHFLAITMSHIASKWFGEGEKYVKSLFSLASKIAPTVIFIDEVDSMLGKREKHGEHEAMRKIKNEFMSNWDGLRTKPYERVIVLAATNRPFDLDDAVLRRFPRRIMVDLPTAEQREKILHVILQGEELEDGFDYKKVAADEFTNGFSGSDLKNLCVAAAYLPIRELLQTERNAKETLSSSYRGSPRTPVQLKSKCPLRPLNLSDFETAKREISASMSEDSFTMQEVRKWNDIYGDGGSRRTTTLSYYM